MDFQFDNSILREACQRLRDERNDQNLIKAAVALKDTQVLMPAKWDKDPQRLENGKIQFDDDAKVSPMVVTNEKGIKLFPFFTSIEELKKFYGGEAANCLVMSSEQIMPMLKNAKEDVIGLVIDPAGADMPFPTEFLEGFFERYRSPLRQQALNKNSSLYLKDPTGDLQDMEAALISGGFHDKAIKSIYLKERLDTDKPEANAVSWFILVDADEKDTGIFTRLSALVKPAAKDKDIEFMFADSNLGRSIMNNSKPIYVKAF